MTDRNSSTTEYTTIELPSYVLDGLRKIVELEGLSSLDEAITLLLIRQ